MKVWKTIEEIKTANESIGQTWFGPDEEQFFKSRVESGVINGNQFITSELGPGQSNRRYTIRQADAKGKVTTVGDFQQYSTLQAAIADAWKPKRKEKS